MTSLQSLNERSQAIFRHIVETYLETGDPVGSRTISRLDGIELSAATIRNVMADLEEVGLINAPHTSAGRVPTDFGLRLFVDGLMQIGDLTKEERAAITGKLGAAGGSVEDILADASRALSGLSHCASLVMVPKEELAVRHMEIVPLSTEKALVVLVAEDGSVENRLIDIPVGVPPSSLVRAGNFLSARLLGRSLSDARTDIEAELAQKQSELDVLTEKAIKAGLAVWSGDRANASLIISGQGNLLEGVEDLGTLERIRSLFDELEHKKDLMHTLDLARNGRGVRLFIGSENNLFSLSGSSLIVAPYMRDANKIIGVIGVIGPTRLNYARIIPMVDYTAQIVSRLL